MYTFRIWSMAANCWGANSLHTAPNNRAGDDFGSWWKRNRFHILIPFPSLVILLCQACWVRFTGVKGGRRQGRENYELFAAAIYHHSSFVFRNMRRRFSLSSGELVNSMIFFHSAIVVICKTTLCDVPRICLNHVDSIYTTRRLS